LILILFFQNVKRKRPPAVSQTSEIDLIKGDKGLGYDLEKKNKFKNKNKITTIKL
jgi:hypothetical protein